MAWLSGIHCPTPLSGFVVDHGSVDLELGRCALEELDRWIPDGWFLGFYDFRRRLESVEDLVPGVGDVLARARRNGAREGTPFFLDPSGRADAAVNGFWRAPGVRGLASSTKRRYAFSLKVWLDFLHQVGVRWDRVDRSVLAAFKEWRLSAEDNPGLVASASFKGGSVGAASVLSVGRGARGGEPGPVARDR